MEKISHARPGLVVSNLSKSYGRKQVVDDVSFVCERGTVTGFVGPNGSGKSTTLRLIVHHSHADAGQSLFAGRPFDRLDDPGRTVGVLLDASAQHPGRTVAESARLAALMIGLPKGRVLRCLSAVGLDRVHGKRVGSLSLGMRQRLGLAIAILGAPRFLILDEPANGLDPEGILWLRDFLRRFAGEGGTVLVSSHQLAEVEAAADSVVMIDRGRVVGEAIQESRVSSRVDSSNARVLGELLTARGLMWSTSPGRGLLVEAEPRVVGQVACDGGVALEMLSRVEESLETRFGASTEGEYVGLRGDDLVDVAMTRSGR